MKINKKAGFTILELVVVMLIMGTLFSIRISKMSASDTGAIKATVKSDMRNAITVINSCFRDELDYKKCVGSNIDLKSGENSLTNTNYKIRLTEGNTGTISIPTRSNTFPKIVITNSKLPSNNSKLIFQDDMTTVSDFQ